MKKALLASILLASAHVSHAQAQNVDIIGGPGGDSAQTMHHCGYLPTGSAAGFGYASYTSTDLTARIVQTKLQQLGYYRMAIDGKFGRGSKAATRAFQEDYGLPADGIVNGETASRIAYATHPAANVQRCYRQASNSWR